MSGEISNEFFKYESALIQKMNLFINQFAEIASLHRFRILFDGARQNWFYVSDSVYVKVSELRNQKTNEAPIAVQVEEEGQYFKVIEENQVSSRLRPRKQNASGSENNDPKKFKSEKELLTFEG